MLHALNHAFNREAMDNLLFLAVPTMENIWYSGDAVLRFAGLIAAGLVEIVESKFSVGVIWGSGSVPTSPPTTSVRLRLSEKGRLLVDSWKQGDQEGYILGLARFASTSPK
jgi:hypothetical protein